jgi:hypothetical protein
MYLQGECRGDDLLEIGEEALAIDRAVESERRADPVRAQLCDAVVPRTGLSCGLRWKSALRARFATTSYAFVDSVIRACC